MRTLFLHPPSFDGYDGGAGARYQMKREVRSFWYPTWLAQPAALVEGSKLIDAPPHDLSFEDIQSEFKNRDLVVMHTSTPSFKSDVRTAEMIKAINPDIKIGFIGAKVAVEPEKSLIAGRAVDFVARNEFDFTVKEVADGKPWSEIKGLSYRNREGVIAHNEDREILQDMDALPWVTPVYKRDLTVEKYFGGYLKPNPVLLPLNVLSEITRSFSLAVRLFGNIMSDDLVLAIVLALAGLFVPIPFMAFAILVGLVQAYIFTVLAAVYIGGGLGVIEK